MSKRSIGLRSRVLHLSAALLMAMSFGTACVHGWHRGWHHRDYDEHGDHRGHHHDHDRDDQGGHHDYDR